MKIVDETGHPIEGAEVTIWRNPWIKSRILIRPLLYYYSAFEVMRFSEILESHLTDKEGVTQFRFRDRDFSQRIYVIKEGYYDNHSYFYDEHNKTTRRSPYSLQKEIAMGKTTEPYQKKYGVCFPIRPDGVFIKQKPPIGEYVRKWVYGTAPMLIMLFFVLAWKMPKIIMPDKKYWKFYHPIFLQRRKTRIIILRVLFITLGILTILFVILSFFALILGSLAGGFNVS